MSPHNAEINRPLIGLITNPNSRRNRSQLAAIDAIVSDHPRIHHLKTADQGRISEALDRFAELEIDLLAINGGDGTVARVLTALLQHKGFGRLPRIALLPGGTTNMNVGDVGIPGRLSKSIRRLAQWAAGGKGTARYLRRPILRVQGGPDASPEYGLFFGAGTIIRGIEYCQERVHSRGVTDEIGPGLVMLRTIWGIARREPYFADPTPIRIELDCGRDTQTREVILLLITSLERLFLGMRPYWGSEEEALHCTWVQKPTHRLLRSFPSLIRGRRNPDVSPENGYFSHNADQIRLWMDGTFTLDGEMHHASRDQGPVTISHGGELEFVKIR